MTNNPDSSLSVDTTAAVALDADLRLAHEEPGILRDDPRLRLSENQLYRRILLQRDGSLAFSFPSRYRIASHPNIPDAWVKQLLLVISSPELFSARQKNTARNIIWYALDNTNLRPDSFRGIRVARDALTVNEFVGPENVDALLMRNPAAPADVVGDIIDEWLPLEWAWDSWSVAMTSIVMNIMGGVSQHPHLTASQADRVACTVSASILSSGNIRNVYALPWLRQVLDAVNSSHWSEFTSDTQALVIQALLAIDRSRDT